MVARWFVEIPRTYTHFWRMGWLFGSFWKDHLDGIGCNGMGGTVGGVGS